MPRRLFEPCVPSRAVKVPAGPDWIHEIKHEGIVESALRNISSSMARPCFWASTAFSLRRSAFPKVVDEVQLYAFDAPVADGGDLRKLPLSVRKTDLARLLARRPEGIFVAAFETGEIGPDLFRKAWEFGVKGLVSKHTGRAYRPGRSPNWWRVKNPKHPAMRRVNDVGNNQITHLIR